MPTFKLKDLTDKPELVYKLNQLGGGGSTTLQSLTDVDVSGVTGGQILRYDETSGNWVASNDNNNYVTQNATTTSNYKKILLAYNDGTSGSVIGNTTNISYVSRYVEVQPRTNSIKANAFVTRNGTSSQFVKGDGTLDSSTYLSGTSIVVTPSESQIKGYVAGKINYQGTNYDFIVNPARIVASSGSGYDDCNQGVVRPQIEFLKERYGNIFNTGVSYSINDDDEFVYALSSRYTGSKIFIPITIVYRYNSTIQRYESIPFLAVDEETFSSMFSSMYGEYLCNGAEM